MKIRQGTSKVIRIIKWEMENERSTQIVVFYQKYIDQTHGLQKIIWRPLLSMFVIWFLKSIQYQWTKGIICIPFDACY